jgi:Tol biopolymer transport system component
MIAEMTDGIEATIIGGPEYSQGDSDTIVWWLVELDDGTQAWVAANKSQQTLLVPAMGEEVDKAIASVSNDAEGPPSAESGILYPSRPILYTDIGAEGDIPSIHAVNQDGTYLGMVGTGVLIGWSPQGDRFAYLALDDPTGFPNSLVVAAIGEEGKTIFETEPGELIANVGPQSAWSPDGTQIALVLDKEETGRVVLVDVSSGQIVGEFPVQDPLSTVSGYLGLPTVKWSPDGQQLLLKEYGEVVVLSIKSGQSKSISPSLELGAMFPSREEWLSSSDDVIYLDIKLEPESIELQLLRTALDAEKPEQLLTEEQLKTLGIDIEDRTSMSIRLSPMGTYLALIASSGFEEHGNANLLIFDLSTLESELVDSWVISQPVAQWELAGSIISPVVWSPDEKALAFLDDLRYGVYH